MTHRPRSRRRLLAQPLRATVLATLAALALPAAPAEFHWRPDCATATWDSFCWSPFAGGPAAPLLPGADASVFIRQASATPRTLHYRQAGPAPLLRAVTVDASGAGSMTLAQDRDTLQTAFLTLGAAGAGAMSFGGGQLTVTTRLLLGDGAGARGSFAQAAGSFNALGDVIVGAAGQGLWQHAGGSAAVSGSVVLGQRAGGSGNLQLSGGQLAVLGDLRSGDGFGALRLDGGTLDVRGQLQLDSVVLAGAAGNDLRFDVVAGRTFEAGTLVVGQAGQGTLTVTGQATAGSAVLGQLAGAGGTLWLQSGGRFEATALQRGAGQSTLWLDGGTLALDQAFDVDTLAIGHAQDARWTSTQNHRVRGALVLGQGTGTEGTLVLGAGNFSAAQMVAGAGRSRVVFDGGFLTLDDGRLAVDELVIAPTAGDGAVHIVRRDQLLRAGLARVGDAGTGALAISGGTAEIGRLRLGEQAGSRGTLAMNSGELRVQGIERGAGGSWVEIYGGRLDVTGDADIGTLLIGSPDGPSFEWQGPGRLRADRVSLGFMSIGEGSFAQRAGLVQLGSLDLGDAGARSHYRLSGGELHVIGAVDGQGTLSVTGGTLRFDGSLAPGVLALGAEGGDVGLVLAGDQRIDPGLLVLGGAGQGRLRLEGGQVRAQELVVGGAGGAPGTGARGAVELQQGTVVVQRELWVGRDGGGTWAQQAGTGLEAGSLVLGTGSEGHFEQWGGSTYLGSLSMGHGSDTASGHGRLTLHGGVLQVLGDAALTPSHHGSRSTLVQHGGTLQIDGKLAVGAAGVGRFELHGGTARVGGALWLGQNGGEGTLWLTGGTLQADGGIRRGPYVSSTIILDGGTLLTTALVEAARVDLGSAGGRHGTHLQSGGTVRTSFLRVGVAGEGDWRIDDGRLEATRLSLGSVAGGLGRLDVRGGEVVVDMLELQQGELDLLGGSLMASRLALHSAAPGGRLNVDGGRFEVLSGEVSPVGELRLGATAVVDASFALRRGAEIHGLLRAAELLAGTGVHNSGRVEIATRMETAADSVNQGLWRAAGHMGGTGRFVNEAVFEQTGALTLVLPVHNAGSWQQLAGSTTTLHDAIFTNAGQLDLARSPLLGSGRLVNAAGGLVLGAGRVETAFDNEGTLLVDAGTATFARGFVNRGEVQMAAASATLAGGTVRNEGTVAGQGHWRAGLDNAGRVEALGGTLVLHALSAQTGTLAAGTGARLRVAGGLARQDGLVALDGGQYDNDGAAQRNVGRIEGAGTWHGGPLTNAGVLSASGGALRVAADVVAVAGSTTRATGHGRLVVDGAFELQRDAVLRVADGSAAAFLGAVRLRNGSVVEGGGAIDFEGSLAVGDSPGTAWLPGDVRFGSGHVYAAEIGGLVPGGGFDQLVVGGTLTLGGTLSLVWWDGFSAVAGDRFDLFDAAALAGAFDTLDFSGAALAEGLVWDTSTLHLDGVLAVAAVPEPGTWAMWLAGAAVLLGVARRRVPRD